MSSSSWATSWRPGKSRSESRRARARRRRRHPCSGHAEAAKLGGQARLSGDRQGGHGRRRPRHARGPDGGPARRGHRSGPARGRRRLRRSGRVPRKIHRPVPATSKCSCSATSTAIWSISSSAIARCSAAIRRSSRSPRHRTSSQAFARASWTRPWPSAGRSASTTPAPSNSCSTSTPRQFYFIEVNPRIQVEHTVTEEITGLRPRQIADPDRPGPAAGRSGNRPWQPKRTWLPHGFALQCRVTTEDPANSFMPDYGRLSHYRSASGMGIRLDAGTAFSGAVITPFYDSLLVKVTAHGLRFVDAARRMERCLQEFRVRGVKTNIPFLLNLVTASRLPRRPAARRASSTRRRSCSILPLRQDRATKVLTTSPRSSSTAIPMSGGKGQGNAEPPLPGSVPRRHCRRPPRPLLRVHCRTIPAGHAATNLHELGPDKFAGWVRRAETLAADRHDLPRRPSIAAGHADADLSTCCRSPRSTPARMPICFRWRCGAAPPSTRRCGSLKEDPWQRLIELRDRMPNILFQMLLRANNAVGYTNYPDNVVKALRQGSAQAGIDLFRIFDALNWLPNLKLAIEAVRAQRHAVRAGHLLHRRHPRSEADQIQPEVLRRSGQGTGKARGQPARPSRTWPGCASRTPPGCWCKTLQAGDRHPDPFPHARLRRRPDRRRCCWRPRKASTSSMPPWRRLSGMTSQPSLNTLVEACVSADATPAWTSSRCSRPPTTGRGCAAIYRPFESGQLAAQRRGLSPRNARRPVHESLPAGRRRWASTAAGTRSAGCTPRSIACSATSSR